MNFEISNVAKVKNSNIQIKGITIITGYNGSGKSTICKSLYAILNACAGLNFNIQKERERSIIDCLNNWYSDNSNHIEAKEKITYYNFAYYFVEYIKTNKIEMASVSLDELSSILINCGATTTDEIILELKKSLDLVVKKSEHEYIEFIVDKSFSACFKDQINSLVSEDSVATIKLENANRNYFVEFKSNMVGKHSLAQLNMKSPIYIETINYLDVINYGKDVFLSLDPKIPSRALDNDGIANPTLEVYNEIKKSTAIADQIMKEVTHGELISNFNGISFKERFYNKNIACENIASGLKLFLIIQKMLSNGTLNSNSVLIVDEPEVNLHPEWQVKLAEFLVLIYNRLGVKMVLSTHSPYFMRAIEVKLAENEIADYGKFYYMQEDGENSFITKDVTGNTDIVYSTMYKPLEEL